MHYNQKVCTEPRWARSLFIARRSRKAAPRFRPARPGILPHDHFQAAGRQEVVHGQVPFPAGRTATGEAATAPWLLYDIVVDPGEHRDLAAEPPELVAEPVAEWETDWR